MITYSTNFMGPIATRWYEDKNIPFVMKETSGKILPKTEYKEFLESYSGGRIDIRDDTKLGFDGWDEYSVAPMRTEDWNAFSDWLYNMQTEELWSYEKLIEHFQYYNKADIRWAD